MQDLRLQISSLKQQLMERESHWSQAQSLLQSRVEALTRENQELHSRLNVNKRSHQSAGSSALQSGSYSTVRANSNHNFSTTISKHIHILYYIKIYIKIYIYLDILNGKQGKKMN